MSKITVTIPAGMHKETSDDLINRISEKFGISESINIISDNDIIGGFILNNDGKITDCSVKSQLLKIRKHLTE